MTDQPPAPSTPETGGTAATVPPPKKRSGASKVILGIAGLLAVAVVAVVAVIVVRSVISANDPTRNAKAGDCLGNLPETLSGGETSVKDVKVVACDSADAKYVVVGRVEDVTSERAAGEVCTGHAEATMQFYAIPAGGASYVLCLKPS